MRSEKEVQDRLTLLMAKNAKLMSGSKCISHFMTALALLSANTLAINELQWVLSHGKEGGDDKTPPDR